jgi:hypothetical protein
MASKLDFQVSSMYTISELDAAVGGCGTGTKTRRRSSTPASQRQSVIYLGDVATCERDLAVTSDETGTSRGGRSGARAAAPSGPRVINQSLSS